MSTIEVRVPALGDIPDVGVIEIQAKVGAAVKREDPLVTLESDKATMDVPSPRAGTVRELKVKVGDRVREGTVILALEVAEEGKAPTPTATPNAVPAPTAAPTAAATPTPVAPPTATPAPLPGRDRGEGDEPRATATHASPSVRRLARELGVELARVAGSGPRGRVLQEDVQRYVKQVLAGAAPAGAARGGGTGLDLLPWPQVDFARFGPVETRPLPRIRRIAAANLARNWVMIPHVTQHDEADITDLEDLRVRLNQEQGPGGVKVTMLAFLVKACATILPRFPEVNASLDGESLVLKRYVHVGFAADTPQGLLVPVIRDADRKGVLEIARETGELAARARDGKLAPGEMQGGSFTITSLGGIGGTAFTPIIQAPEVAILGVSRSAIRPVWDGKQFAPRRMLPLSLSYDHRVVDGALAVRFTTALARLLGDLRRAML